ncbi:MAG: terminase gpA endonuclease subunit, partial [Planctomycetota bacterium]
KNAADILDTIRTAIGESDEFLRYYPEACVPVRALENTVQRAKTQVANGERFDNGKRFETASTCFHWTGDRLIFPNVPGSPSAGAIVISQGLDASLRGMRIKNRRPRAVVIDDPDTEESVHNPTQATKLLRKIDRSIAALGSQRNPVSRLVLCTCASRVSAAAQLTDQDKYPSFRGRRMRFLLKPPANHEAWAEFVTLCKQGWMGETVDVRESPIPRIAHEFYLSHRADMDAGGEVANPHRFDHRIRPEGGTVEVSALEHYYGWVARIGPANTATEFDNDPPDELGLLDLTPEQIRESRSGYGYRVVPPETVRLTIGADVKKLGLHWAAIAWDARCVGSIVEFHFWRFSTAGHRPEACENAVLEGLRDWWQWIQTHKPWREDLESEETARFPDWTLIDSGWKDEGWSMQPVAVFASEVGFRRCLPCKGFGRYRRPQPQLGIRSFDECHIDWRSKSPLCDVNADAYKTRVHEGFKADFGTPGSLGLHDPRVGADGRQMRSSLEEEREYSAHIISEQWDATKAKFLPPNGPNHYLDATSLARVGASLSGLSSIPSESKSSKPRKSLAEMAGQ